MVTARQKVVGGSCRVARSGSIDRESARLELGPGRDSDLSIGTHGERALSDAPLMVLHVSGITASPVSRHKSDAKPRSKGAVARVGVGRIHWKFDGLTEEGRQAQLSPKVRCRESSTAVRALASAFENRKINTFTEQMSRRAFVWEWNDRQMPRTRSRRVRTRRVPLDGSHVRLSTVREVRDKK